VPLPSEKKHQSTNIQPKKVEIYSIGAIRFELLRRSRNLRESFLLLDSNRSNSITFQELKHRLVEIGVPIKLVRSDAFEGELKK
jgi:hypothetical protein